MYQWIDGGFCISLWWRHQMETFSTLLTLLCGEFTGHRLIPTQRPMTLSFDIFFNLRRNKRSSKQSWGWWFETLSCLLWRHCNVDESEEMFVLFNSIVEKLGLYNGHYYGDPKFTSVLITQNGNGYLNRLVWFWNCHTKLLKFISR